MKKRLVIALLLWLLLAAIYVAAEHPELVERFIAR